MKNIDSDLLLVEKLKNLRQRVLTKQHNMKPKPSDRPVTFWMKKDRLMNEIGKEFTIILRTKGCSWALGKYGGCTMCGYIQDANTEVVEAKNIVTQFNYGINNKIKEISQDKDNFVLKIFNSGSFFDDNEISDDARLQIYEKIESIDKLLNIISKNLKIQICEFYNR